MGVISIFYIGKIRRTFWGDSTRLLIIFARKQNMKVRHEKLQTFKNLKSIFLLLTAIRNLFLLKADVLLLSLEV